MLSKVGQQPLHLSPKVTVIAKVDSMFVNTFHGIRVIFFLTYFHKTIIEKFSKKYKKRQEKGIYTLSAF